MLHGEDMLQIGAESVVLAPMGNVADKTPSIDVDAMDGDQALFCCGKSPYPKSGHRQLCFTNAF